MSILRNSPANPTEAFALGLFLALTAPSEELGQEIADATEHIVEIEGLSEEEVDKAKAVALAEAEIWNNSFKSSKGMRNVIGMMREALGLMGEMSKKNISKWIKDEHVRLDELSEKLNKDEEDVQPE